MRPNVYTICDSNHGYKMIGVGREVAKVLVGEHSKLLVPFRFERFATGRPAPRLELAVPLVVAYVDSAAPRRAARSRSGSSARDRASASKRSGP